MRMKGYDYHEYGGYLELENFHGKEFHEKAITLNCGRSCVEYLIRAGKVKKLYLPYFLCSSVKGVCERLNIPTEYYHIGMDFLPEWLHRYPLPAEPLANETEPAKPLRDGEYLYIVNYYGQLANETLSEIVAAYGNVIVDNVQAFFQEPVSGIDTLYSCRKFFGVADGAYLYTDVDYGETIEEGKSLNQMHFVLGRYEENASLFYAESVKNNHRFAEESMRSMSRLTHNLLRGIDYGYARDCRTRNFAFLHSCFADENLLSLTIPNGAFMYPLYVENGAEVRKRLQREKIYIPTLWPDVFDVCAETDLEYRMAENILPLPVDQRYGIEDMEYIADRTKELIAECKVRRE